MEHYAIVYHCDNRVKYLGSEIKDIQAALIERCENILDYPEEYSEKSAKAARELLTRIFTTRDELIAWANEKLEFLDGTIKDIS